MEVEELVERSRSLKQELLDLGRRPQFDRAFRQETPASALLNAE